MHEIGIRSATRLGFEECRHEGRGHLLERMPFLLVTDEFKGFCDLVHVTFQGRFQQGALIGEVLIKSSDRHAGSQRHLGRSQPFLTHLEQNLRQMRTPQLRLLHLRIVVRSHK